MRRAVDGEGEGTGRWARLCDLHPAWDRLSRLECEQWTVETSTLTNLNVKRPMVTVMEKRREVGGPEEDEIYRNCRLLVLRGSRGRKQEKERSRGPLSSPPSVLASPAPSVPLPLCPPAPSSPAHPAQEPLTVTPNLAVLEKWSPTPRFQIPCPCPLSLWPLSPPTALWVAFWSTKVIG